MAELIEAITALFGLLFVWLGPGWTVLLFVVGVSGSLLFRRHADNRKDHWINVALEEKEKSLQRVADEARQWRSFYAVQSGMDKNQADKLFRENKFLTPAESRKALEQPATPPRTGPTRSERRKAQIGKKKRRKKR